MSKDTTDTSMTKLGQGGGSPHVGQAGTAPIKTHFSTKITDEHLRRQATLYIRQSTNAQLREHQESTARQYAMKDRLIALGWAETDIITIDDDLGISGTGKSDRPGFRRLLKAVTDEQVGIVIGLEMSRLARNSKDWSDLFEVCAIFNTPIADEDGVFHPHDPNDRLVLGLKGIISEMELHTMKVRLERGRLSKAQRGELFHEAPVGYVLDEQGLPQRDPDESARHVMKLFFDLFWVTGSASGLFHYLAKHAIKLPFRDSRGGPISWRLAAKTTVYELLKHPLYAGAYGYGRKKRYDAKTAPRAGGKYLPPSQWKVLLLDRHPAYITWQQYEQNQQRLHENNLRKDRSGPPREGSALLGGRIRCARCGRRMSINYPRRGNALYLCSRHSTVAQAQPCQSTVGCDRLDKIMIARLLEALSPAGLQLSLQVIGDEQTRREQIEKLYVQRVEKARYEADLTERRYKQVDPANRLVAGQLESHWESALKEHQVAIEELDALRNQKSIQLSDEEQQELRDTCADIQALWDQSLSVIEKKEIIRLLIDRVDVDVIDNSERVSLHVHWSGGFQSCYGMTRSVMRFNQMESYASLISRIETLAKSGMRSREIARHLEQEGFHSPRHDKPISSMMVQNLMSTDSHLRQQLSEPELKADQWKACELANHLGMPTKRLKDWVTRGWVTAVQRPFGRTWVIFADSDELHRLNRLWQSQNGQGRPAPPEELMRVKPFTR